MELTDVSLHYFTEDEIIDAIIIMSKGDMNGKKIIRDLLKQIKEIRKNGNEN